MRSIFLAAVFLYCMFGRREGQLHTQRRIRTPTGCGVSFKRTCLVREGEEALFIVTPTIDTSVERDRALRVYVFTFFLGPGWNNTAVCPRFTHLAPQNYLAGGQIFCSNVDLDLNRVGMCANRNKER